MSSSASFSGVEPVPVTVLQYKDMSDRANREMGDASGASKAGDQRSVDSASGPKIGAAELRSHVERARAEAAIEMERRISAEYEQKLTAARASVAKVVTEFDSQQREYFARVEAEVVQLALAIAAKILHREAQVDPMLVAALVRISLEKMREGSSVTIRVGAGHSEAWKKYLSGVPNLIQVEVCEDSHLSEQDCLVETELGSASFGLDAQLKEVEQGFFDLLALRPARP